MYGDEQMNNNVIMGLNVLLFLIAIIDYLAYKTICLIFQGDIGTERYYEGKSYD